jgi:hypothetical protein
MQGQSAQSSMDDDTLAVRRNLGPATLRARLAFERHCQDECAPLLAVFLGR